MITRDEIIKMVREAGFVDESFCRWGAYSDDLERFFHAAYAAGAAAERERLTHAAMLAAEKAVDAAIALEREACMRETERLAVLIAAAEREACAKVCEERGKGWLEVKNARTIDEGCMHAAAKAEATALAAAIRERGEK